MVFHDGENDLNADVIFAQINTLYVGNLPTSPPPTHPPSHLEDALRALFQRREGFHRMSFRQKSNGPMCFVEVRLASHSHGSASQ